MQYNVADLDSDAAIRIFLEQDRKWAAYALCDLDAPYQANAHYIGAMEGALVRGILLLYQLPGTTSILPYGEPDATEAILRHTRDLPDSIFLIADNAHVPVVEVRYKIVDRWSMWRMVIKARDLRVSRPVDFPRRRLTTLDIPAVRALYRQAGTVFFDDLMLASGVYLGAFEGEHLIAVAGTHTISRRSRIGAVGGVFTRPDYRGRGLATALTSDVCRVLAEQAIDLIVLNVRQNNDTAVAAYKRLGFVEYMPYWEGHATLASRHS